MGRRGAEFGLGDQKMKLRYKKAQYDIFEQTWHITLVERRFTAANQLNVVGVSPEFFTQIPARKMLLINPDTGKFANVLIKLCEGIHETKFAATAYLKEILNLEAGGEAFLCQYKELKFNRVLPQKIDHIRGGNLVISESDYNDLCFDLQKSPCKFFEIYNTFSQDSMVIEKTHIIADAALAPGTIRLSRRQRICLGLELPLYLSDEQWNVLNEKLDHNSEEYQTICELYPSEERVLDKSASYDKKSKAKDIIFRVCPGDIHMAPIPESTYAKKKSVLRRLCDFYVGKSTISLACRRPYDIDEGVDIVRITKSNMNLLGIDEMDKVILQYKNKRISCRVLELDDQAAFDETNLPVAHDLAIGVPIHIRKKLHVMDLASSIKVDRDTGFIFKKCINEQIVPVIITLFSTTELFTDTSVVLSGLLSLITIPIVLYLNLSSKRNMRT